MLKIRTILSLNIMFVFFFSCNSINEQCEIEESLSVEVIKFNELGKKVHFLNPELEVEGVIKDHLLSSFSNITVKHFDNLKIQNLDSSLYYFELNPQFNSCPDLVYLGMLNKKEILTTFVFQTDNTIHYRKNSQYFIIYKRVSRKHKTGKSEHMCEIGFDFEKMKIYKALDEGKF